MLQGESKKRPSNLKSKFLSNHLSHRNGSVLETNVWMPHLRLDMLQYSRMHIAGEIKQKLRHIRAIKLVVAKGKNSEGRSMRAGLGM